MKLLIVDDNSGVREIIRHIMKDKFAEIIEGANGLEAFQLYEKHRPNWVVMDMEMPEVDGLAATTKIKDKFPDAKIVILSRFNDVDITNLSKKAGAVAFFNKDDLTQVASFFESPPQQQI